MIDGVDEELEAELAALRREKQADRDQEAQWEHQQQHENHQGAQRLQQFVAEMQRHRVSPLPIFKMRSETVPGKKKSFMTKEQPRIFRTHYDIVAHGWPIGHVYSDSELAAPPHGYLHSPVVTTDGVLANCFWSSITPGEQRTGTNYNAGPDYGVAALHIDEPHPDMISNASSNGKLQFLANPTFHAIDNGGTYGMLGSARYLAEAMHHYLR